MWPILSTTTRLVEKVISTLTLLSLETIAHECSSKPDFIDELVRVGLRAAVEVFSSIKDSYVYERNCGPTVRPFSHNFYDVKGASCKFFSVKICLVLLDHPRGNRNAIKVVDNSEGDEPATWYGAGM